MTQKNPSIEELEQISLIHERKFEQYMRLALGSALVAGATALSSLAYFGLSQPPIARNYQKASATIQLLEAELNHVNNNDLPYKNKRTSRLESSLKSYKSELQQSIESVKQDVKKIEENPEYKEHISKMNSSLKYMFFPILSLSLTAFYLVYKAKSHEKKRHKALIKKINKRYSEMIGRIKNHK